MGRISTFLQRSVFFGGIGIDHMLTIFSYSWSYASWWIRVGWQCADSREFRSLLTNENIFALLQHPGTNSYPKKLGSNFTTMPDYRRKGTSATAALIGGLLTNLLHLPRLYHHVRLFVVHPWCRIDKAFDLVHDRLPILFHSPNVKAQYNHSWAQQGRRTSPESLLVPCTV